MNAANSRRPFSIERYMAEQRGAPPPIESAAAPATPPVDVAPLLDAVARIEKKLDSAIVAENTNIDQIRTEIADIAGRIQATKVEIAALRHPSQAEDKIGVATSELSQVVAATEAATVEIMDSAERVEDAIREVLASVDAESFAARRLNDATEELVRLYEACNFQDLTGQRISKVVRALNYIEDRVEAMLSHWRIADIEALAPGEAPLATKDDALNLEGPASAQKPDGMSQADIDALFD